MFGIFGPLKYLVDEQGKHHLHGQKEPDTIESLRAELEEAKNEIEKLKRALGSNHSLGYKSGSLF